MIIPNPFIITGDDYRPNIPNILILTAGSLSEARDFLSLDNKTVGTT